MNPQGEDEMSELYQSLSRSKWDSKYNVVFVPKRRRKAIFGQTRRQLGAIFHSMANQKECQIIEGHLMPDHVSHVYRDSTEAPGGVGNRISERKECHRNRPLVPVKREISRASISGLAVTQYRPSGSSWSRSAHTSATRTPRMVPDSFELTNKARIARRLNP